MHTIQVVSDFVCPWCFVGKRRIDQALAKRPDLDVTIEWLPFQLSPDMPREGRLRSEHYIDIFGEERAAVIMASMRDTGLEDGITFGDSESAMSPNTMLAHSLLFMASGEDAVDTDELAERLFSAHHEDCRDLGDIDVLCDIAAAVGMDAEQVRSRLEEGADEAEVSHLMNQIRSSQVSGVPFIVLDGRLALSGAQPVDVLVDALDQIVATDSSD